MKKILILLLPILIITGCTDIKNSSYETLLNETANSSLEVFNTYRNGYKFYLPSSMYVYKSRDYNEVIKNKFDTFYLYIDLISYLSKTPIEYTNGGENYYFSNLSKDDKTGYIVIKITQNDKYLVEIAYNYAKIEVIVEETRIKSTISEAMTILSSIEYNETFLKSLTEESLLSYKEETIDIFKKGETDATPFLKYVDEYDGPDDSQVPDYDLIR